MVWDGSAAEKRLLDHARDKEGKIQRSKIDSYFGKVDGDGTTREDYHYPWGDVLDGTLEYDKDGLIEAFKAAFPGAHGQSGDPEVAKEAARLMKAHFPDDLTEGMLEILGMKKEKNAASDAGLSALNNDSDNVIIAWATWESSEVKSPIDIGVWEVSSKDFNNQIRISRYEFDPEKFTEDTAKKWLEKRNINGVQPSTVPKALNASSDNEPTYEYLKAVWKALKEHPHVLDQIKDDIHKFARASAGGQLKGAKSGGTSDAKDTNDTNDNDNDGDAGDKTLQAAKSFNAAELLPDIVETDEYFDIPTVFAKEGVFTGTDGIPVLRTYETLKANAPRFLGVPLTDTHLLTDTLRPTDRWLGHSISATARDDHRDVFGVSRYFKKELNTQEIERIRNKEFPDASPAFFTSRKPENGEFQGKKYNAVEVGPLVVTEYANFFEDKGFGTKGACPRTDGCGPYQHAAFDSHDPALTGKEGGDMTETDLIETDQTETEPAAPDVNELTERLTNLEKVLNSGTLPNGKEIESIRADLNQVKDEMKNFNSAVKVLTDMQTKEAVAIEAANKAEFGKMLNAANGPDVPEVFDKNWADAKGDILGWRIRNPEKLLNAAPKGSLNGKSLNAGVTAEEAAKAAAHAALAKVGDPK